MLINVKDPGFILALGGVDPFTLQYMLNVLSFISSDLSSPPP